MHPSTGPGATSRTSSRSGGQPPGQPVSSLTRVTRLRDLNQRLTGKLARTHTELTQLKERHRLLLSVLAAKDDEVQRLRHELSTFTSVPDQGQGDDALGVVPLARR